MAYKVATFDTNAINDGTNYRAWFPEHDQRGLPAVNAQMIERTGYWPVLGSVRRPGRRIAMKVSIEGADTDTLRTQLLKWFTPYPPFTDWTGAAAKRLVIEDKDGSNDRYIEAVPVSCTPQPDATDIVYTVILQVHGDPRWRGVEDSSFSTWNLSADSGLNNLNPASQDIVHPIIDITPQAAKSGDYAFQRFMPVRWLAGNAAKYPTDVAGAALDTAALTTAKMQADGDDLRVVIGGTERDRWLGNMDTTTTRVWVNLDFAANVVMTLAAGIASGGSVDTITVNQNIYGLANSGIVQIGSEFFTYTGKDVANKILTGVTRAAHFSTAAAHSAGDNVYWIQHEIFVIYGNSGVSAPLTDDSHMPAFDLDTSTNTSWIFADFASVDGLRSGSWTPYSIQGTPRFYGGNQDTEADPFAELGVEVIGSYPFTSTGIWLLNNPCGITNGNFTNGEQWASALTGTTADIVYLSAGGSPISAFTIAQPSLSSTWEAWSRNQAFSTNPPGVGIRLTTPGSLSVLRLVECADVTVTLNSANTPVTAVGAEQGGYLLNLTLTTLGIQTDVGGIQLNINFPMEVGATLRVDTYNKTVTYLKDNSNQAQAITMLGKIRRDWWPLKGGSSQSVSAEDTGTTDLDIDISYTPRYFT